MGARRSHFFRRHVEIRIHHAQRCQDALTEEIRQRHIRDHLHQIQPSTSVETP